VPVATFTAACPHLEESDILSLSPIFELRQTGLYDTTLCATHGLEPEAQKILAHLLVSVQLGSLLKGFDPEGVFDVLGFLNICGGLQYYRLPKGRLRTTRLWLTLPWTMAAYPALRHRQYFSLQALCKACLHATLHVYIATVFVIALLIATDVARPEDIWLFGGIASALFFSSMFVHELTHCWAIRRYTSRLDVVYSRLQLQIWHGVLSQKAESRIAITGPLVGVMYCSVFVGIGLLFHRQYVTWIAVGLSLLHMCSLLPWYEDGKSLLSPLIKGHKL
jgi:hypothetical protein